MHYWHLVASHPNHSAHQLQRQFSHCMTWLLDWKSQWSQHHGFWAYPFSTSLPLYLCRNSSGLNFSLNTHLFPTTFVVAQMWHKIPCLIPTKGQDLLLHSSPTVRIGKSLIHIYRFNWAIWYGEMVLCGLEKFWFKSFNFGSSGHKMSVQGLWPYMIGRWGVGHW